MNEGMTGLLLLLLFIAAPAFATRQSYQTKLKSLLDANWLSAQPRQANTWMLLDSRVSLQAPMDGGPFPEQSPAKSERCPT
jgi:hypothetical protein